MSFSERSCVCLLVHSSKVLFLFMVGGMSTNEKVVQLYPDVYKHKIRKHICIITYSKVLKHYLGIYVNSSNKRKLKVQHIYVKSSNNNNRFKST